MGAVAAVRILHRRTLADVPAERSSTRSRLSWPRSTSGRPAAWNAPGRRWAWSTRSSSPPDTREALARAIAAAPQVRGQHGNIPL